MRDARTVVGQRSRVVRRFLGVLPALAGLLWGCGGGETAPAAAPEPGAATPTARRPVPAPGSGWFEEVHTRIAAGEYRVRAHGRG